MTTFSDAFRTEVARIARKAVTSEVTSLRKSVSSHRSEIAALKRLLKVQEGQLKALSKAHVKSGPAGQAPEVEATPARSRRKFHFSAEALIAKRKDLRISQKQMAALIGASPAAVYRWETGEVVPRAAQLTRIREVLTLGKRAARALLEEPGSAKE